MLPLVARQLAARMEDVIATGTDTVDVIKFAVVSTVGELALVGFKEFFEAVTQQLFILHMIDLVLLHFALVLEGKLAAIAQTVEVRGLVVGVRASRLLTSLEIANPQETLHFNGVRFSVVVCVHLHITRADVDLVAVGLYAMIMRLFAIELTVPAESVELAVVHAAEPEKTELQRFRPLLVPLAVTHDVLLLAKRFQVASSCRC